MEDHSMVTRKQTSYFKTSVPKMPEGYYSGDKPNPNLRAFVERHMKERPYDPATDKYDVPAFNRPIETTKQTAVYNMHSYHQGKKPHDAIQEYIRHYTKQGDLVLDPFCGSGSTALAALIEGRKAIAIDRSPAATFIASNYCTLVDVKRLRKAFEVLSAKVKPEIDWLYETRCDRCGKSATVDYTVYSQVFQCPRCMQKVALFDCVEQEGESANGKPKKVRICPFCYKRGNVEEISTREERFGAIPVLVGYICNNGCDPAKGVRHHNDSNRKKREYFEECDLAKLREINARVIPHWYPTSRMMNAPEGQQRWGVKWRAGTSNFRTLDELYTKRNLWAIAALFDGINNLEEKELRSALRFSLTGIVLGLSTMNRYMPNASFPFYILTGTYYVPQISCEEPVWKHFENTVKRIEKGYEVICREVGSAACCISTQDSRKLDSIPSNSIDHIFTDPPYADNVQYGELNFIWEAWLKLDTHWHQDEIIINDVRGKTEIDWANMMKAALQECYRVLKTGHWLALCYHDTAEGTWELVQDIMAEVGFVADKTDSALFIDTEQKSFNQINAEKVTKRDLVINFRKPRLGEAGTSIQISGDEDETTFNEKVHTIIRDYLLVYPGSSKDRIYDDVVSRMVRAGQMQAHNFDELLAQVAEPAGGDARSGKWYLQETATTVDTAETAKEDAAAERLTKFMGKWLKQHYGETEGVHYSDLFEEYVVKVTDKPRRALTDWLPDYFFKTEEGTWRLPQDEDESQLKAKVRVSGANRRIKRFVSFLQQGIPVAEKERPSVATLAEWIRQSKRSGLYEYGKLIYEKGGLSLDGLPEELAVDVQEDYETCVRLLGREK